MPIRFRVMPARPGCLAASAATLVISLSASAAQPRFPDPPPVPFEHPHAGDAVPRGVVPSEPLPPAPAPAKPVKPKPAIKPGKPAGPAAGDVPPAPAARHAGPPHADVPPTDMPNPVPQVEPPRTVGPPAVAPQVGTPLEGRVDVPHFVAPDEEHHRFEAVPPVPPMPYDAGPADGRVEGEILPPPYASGPPREWPSPVPGPAFDPAWPDAGPAGPAGLMRPTAPLAPLPPVEADPTLGPPPGTLGHTYYRPSRYVPYDEHPRVGMLDLTLPPELTVDQGEGTKIRVTVHDVAAQLKPLEGFVGTDRHWHFESDPLIPGIPHVYRVKVERVHYEKQEIRRYGRLVEQESEIGADLLGVRYLRLIPGRVVTLEF